MYDLLLSLSCLLIITTFLIPLLAHVHITEQDLRHKNEAITVLQEHIKDGQLSQKTKTNNLSDQMLQDYVITSQPHERFTLFCINWKNRSNNEERMCQYVPSYE